MEERKEFYDRLKRGEVTLFILVGKSCNPKEIKPSDICWMKIGARENAIPGWRSRLDAESRKVGGMKVIEVSWAQIQEYVTKPNMGPVIRGVVSEGLFLF